MGKGKDKPRKEAKKPAKVRPETRLTHERIGSKVLREDPRKPGDGEGHAGGFTRIIT